jgi:hypothetical protein
MLEVMGEFGWITMLQCRRQILGLGDWAEAQGDKINLRHL